MAIINAKMGFIKNQIILGRQATLLIPLQCPGFQSKKKNENEVFLICMEFDS